MTTLNVRLELPSLRALVAEPDITAFSAEYRPYSYTSGLEYIAQRVYAARDVDQVQVTLVVPADEVEADSEEEIGRAIHRWADAKIEETTIRAGGALNRGRRALAWGALGMVVLFILAELLDAASDGYVLGGVVWGLRILAWVAIWFPLDKLAWERWSHGSDRQVYERVKTMEFSLTAAHRLDKR